MDEEWTVRPIVAQDGFSATVDVADKEQGSAIAVKNATNEFELKATANPGYSFDYWLVKSDSSKITENPKTVTLTADETYTAYFRTWKQATVSSEPEGLTSGTDTDLVTAARNGTIHGCCWRIMPCWPAEIMYFPIGAVMKIPVSNQRRIRLK